MTPMDKQTDRLMEDLRAARPAPLPSAEDWVEGDRGRQVLQRVLASSEALAPASGTRAAKKRGSRGRTRTWKGYWTAIAVAAVLVVVLCGSLALLFTVGRGGRPAVAAGVAELSAVEHITQLILTSEAWSSESGTTSPLSQAALLSVATDRGLISSTEITAAAASRPVLEGQYVVLLWKAFGHAFPNTTAPTSPVSGSLDPQVAAAVQGLQGVRVIRESDGAFVPDRPLTSEREQLLLDRMEAALRGQASD